jgi:hypothetical protein
MILALAISLSLMGVISMTTSVVEAGSPWISED